MAGFRARGKERTGLSDRLHSVISRLHAFGRIRLSRRDVRKIHIPDLKFFNNIAGHLDDAEVVDKVLSTGSEYAQLIETP